MRNTVCNVRLVSSRYQTGARGTGASGCATVTSHATDGVACAANQLLACGSGARWPLHYSVGNVGESRREGGVRSVCAAVAGVRLSCRELQHQQQHRAASSVCSNLPSTAGVCSAMRRQRRKLRMLLAELAPVTPVTDVGADCGRSVTARRALACRSSLEAHATPLAGPMPAWLWPQRGSSPALHGCLVITRTPTGEHARRDAFSDPGWCVWLHSPPLAATDSGSLQQDGALLGC
jgi:hypothetical protein